jgi:hypothetical protein
MLAESQWFPGQTPDWTDLGKPMLAASQHPAAQRTTWQGFVAKALGQRQRPPAAGGPGSGIAGQADRCERSISGRRQRSHLVGRALIDASDRSAAVVPRDR